MRSIADGLHNIPQTPPHEYANLSHSDLFKSDDSPEILQQASVLIASSHTSDVLKRTTKDRDPGVEESDACRQKLNLIAQGQVVEIFVFIQRLGGFW